MKQMKIKQNSVNFQKRLSVQKPVSKKNPHYPISNLLARLHEVQKSYCSHPGRTHSRSRSRSTLLKFSRSLYLDNQWSESIHTWTIGTL